MKRTVAVALLYGVCAFTLSAPGSLFAQACKDEELMATENKKTLLEAIDTVKKETLEAFQRGYHQKSSLNKLTFTGTAVSGMLGCLDRAVQDPLATKADIEAYKAKQQAYTKLREKIEEDRKALKAAADAKEAKAIIEKFSYPE